MEKAKKNSHYYLHYILLIVAALLIYYGYLSEGCGCMNKFWVSLGIGVPLLIIVLWRLK